MQFSLILTSLFCFTTRMNMVRAIYCPCAVLSTTRVQHFKIKDYTIQDDDGACLFRAIVFRTVGGKTICSNPKDDWAYYVIQQLKKRQNPKISKDSSSGSESPSVPSAAQESEPTGTPALAPGSELPLVPSTPATASGSEQTETPGLAPSMSSMSPGSEQATAPSAATSGPALLSGSEPTSEPTSAPSTGTSASSTASSSTPSSTTLNPISVKSTPNPTTAPNSTSGASGTRSALHHILATSSTTRRASTQRRPTLSR